MPTYKVKVSRVTSVTMYNEVSVDAPNEAEAEEMALDMYDDENFVLMKTDLESMMWVGQPEAIVVHDQE